MVRPNNRKIDFSMLIWILATNFGDTTIPAYLKRNIKDWNNAEREQKMELSSSAAGCD